MPKYFFSLTESVWPHQPGEELFDDAEARRYAELVTGKLDRCAKRPSMASQPVSGSRDRAMCASIVARC